MTFERSRRLPTLVFALALGAATAWAGTSPRFLAPAQIAFHRSQQTLRAGLAQDHLQARRASLGLGSLEGFRTAAVSTNALGEAIVRLDHTFDGHRVLGSQAVARVPLGGAVEASTDAVLKGVALSGQPLLTPATATAIALRHLAPRGPMEATPRVEQVVFPASFLGGPATVTDPVTGKASLDRHRTVHARMASPYVWAFEVRTRLANKVDGRKELTYHIDARTGAILRVVDEVRHQAVPATATGRGQYSGTVEIPSARMADGTYALYDPTRGTQPNPTLQSFTPDESGWSATGLQTWYEQNDAQGNNTWMSYLFQGNATNAWGDGLPFTAYGDEGGPNGQTMGVDAMHGMAWTWDFFQNVLGRAGMDGKGTSVFAQVGCTGTYSRENAAWSNWDQGMALGTGTPGGPGAFTDFDVIAHEMTHGVTGSTVGFLNTAGFEEAGLDEGTSDFFAQMAKAYAAAGDPYASTLPASGADWTIGAGVFNGTPLRWMNKPSLDLRSPDAWYHGIHYLDGHYSSGVLNRALYYLANGAPADASHPAYSPFLPQGMTGIGYEKTARIWYMAVSEILVSGGSGQLTFLHAREAARRAALYLYGEGSTGWGWDSPASRAVENAFGAVNVGLNYGEAPRTQVRFADFRNADWIERHHADSALGGSRQYFPMGERVRPMAQVLNNANTAVSWTVGGRSLFNGAEQMVHKGGVINADGTWTTPTDLGWFALTATSVADPRQSAEGRAFIVNLDADSDLEQDAVDMGALSYSWYLTNALNPAHSVFNAPWVDDGDVATFTDAVLATWWVR